MAFLAAAPMIEAGMAAAPEILNAANMAASLASKYGPKVRGSVNHLFHAGRKKKSAMTYLRGLGSAKGLEKFITRDLGKVMGGASRAIGEAGSFAADVSHFTSEGTRGGAIGEHANRVAQVVGGGARHASRYHNLAEKYIAGGQTLVSPLNRNYRY